MQFLAGVFLGFFAGMCASFGAVIYIGKREIKKRGKRSQDWQKIKKEVDKSIMKEWDI